MSEYSRSYPIIYQQTRDIDWFAMYRGKWIHVASNGGKVPDAIRSKSNGEILKSLCALPELFQLAPSRDSLRRNLEQLTGQQYYSQKEMEEYLETFEFFAKRGFVSLDRASDETFEYNYYFIAASPDSRKEPEDILSNMDLTPDQKEQVRQIIQMLPRLEDDELVVEGWEGEIKIEFESN